MVARRPGAVRIVPARRLTSRSVSWTVVALVLRSPQESTHSTSSAAFPPFAASSRSIPSSVSATVALVLSSESARRASAALASIAHMASRARFATCSRCVAVLVPSVIGCPQFGVGSAAVRSSSIVA